MVFWRLKCVSPGYAGPFRLWLRRTCLFVVCCVMSVSCFACMLWHVAVCFYGLIPSDLAVFCPCALMFVSVPAFVRLQLGSVA